jgi:hypothetical protein
MQSFLKAAEIVSRSGYGSAQLLMHELQLGYNRVHPLLRMLQAEGILGDEMDGRGHYALLRPIGFF